MTIGFNCLSLDLWIPPLIETDWQVFWHPDLINSWKQPNFIQWMVMCWLHCQTNQQTYLTVFKLFYDFSWKYPNQSYLLISQTINADYILVLILWTPIETTLISAANQKVKLLHNFYQPDHQTMHLLSTNFCFVLGIWWNMKTGNL